MTLLCVSRLYFIPVHNPPQSLEMSSAAVLVVEVVGVFPDVEGEEGAEMPGLAGHDAGDGVAGVGLLGDDEGAIGIGGEPDPAGAEEGGAF